MKNKILLTVLTGIATSASAEVIVSSNITSSTTWTAVNSPYILEGPVYVTNDSVLTIEPGVIIRGQPDSDFGQGDAGTLVITRGSQIDAQGTPTEPIIFTTAAVDNDGNGIADGLDAEITLEDGDEVFRTRATRYNPAADPADTFLDADPLNNPLPPAVYDTNGDIVVFNSPSGQTFNGNIVEVPAENRQLCGGVVILGRAPTNNSGANDVSLGLNENFIEGLSQDANGTYGGFNPNDNSGVVSYFSIRHGGSIIGTANEINGLTLGGVGYGTQIDHVEVYCNADDGFEFFGGTVNTKYLAAHMVNDDAFDHDEGFTGLGQFWFSIYNADGRNGDKAGEHDGATGRVNSLGVPFTYPTIYNATFIGSGTVGDSEAFRIRDNWGGQYFNSIFVEFPGDGVEFEDDGLARLVAGQVTFEECTWWNINYDGTNFDNTATGLTKGGNDALISGSVAAVDGLLSAGGNRIVDPGFAPFNRRAVNGINPAPSVGIGTALFGSFGKPFTSTFFTPVGYKGAFSTVQSQTLWTTGWTALNKRNILVDRGDLVNVN